MDFLSEVVVTNCGGAMGTAVGNAFAQSNGNPKLGFIRTGDEHIHVSASSEFSLRSLSRFDPRMVARSGWWRSMIRLSRKSSSDERRTWTGTFLGSSVQA